jgi:predicted AAA+ superfamily ATPase
MADPDQFPLMLQSNGESFPELFIAINRAVECDRTPGCFILSGSAIFLLMKNVADSLVGRAVYFHLHAFT